MDPHQLQDMEGPSDLSSISINQVVENDRIGVYILGEKIDYNTIRPKYVGRSDDDLKYRLHQHILQGIAEYPAFTFGYKDDAESAYARECQLYHWYKDHIDNKNHPDSPTGMNSACPVCEHPSH